MLHPKMRMFVDCQMIQVIQKQKNGLDIESAGKAPTCENKSVVAGTDSEAGKSEAGGISDSPGSRAAKSSSPAAVQPVRSMSERATPPSVDGCDWEGEADVVRWTSSTSSPGTTLAKETVLGTCTSSSRM